MVLNTELLEISKTYTTVIHIKSRRQTLRSICSVRKELALEKSEMPSEKSTWKTQNKIYLFSMLKTITSKEVYR